MQQAMVNRRLRISLLQAQYVGLFSVLLIYLYLRIRPELFYYLSPHVFLFDSHFFYGMVGQPGGVVDYVSAFLSPLFVWSWLGALIVTLLVALVCLATRGLFVAMAGKGGSFVFLLPAVLILMVVGQYCHPVRLCVGLAIALLCANLYTRMGGYSTVVRLAVFAVVSGILYFAAAGFYSIFACLCGCYEFGVQRRRRFGLLCMLCAVAVPIAASRWPFDLILQDAFRGLQLPEGQHWLAIPSSPALAVAVYTAALLFPLIAAIVLTWRRKPSPGLVPDSDGSSAEANPPPDAAASELKGPMNLWAAPLAVLLLVLLADVATFDSTKRCLLATEYSSEQHRWEDVLAWAGRLPSSDARAYDPRILYCVNRALYFQGDLLDRMFAHPQALATPSLALVCDDIDTTSMLTPRQCSEIFFDFGRVNESEQMAYEALELCGDRPEVLKRLVHIYVIKGEPEAARQFLSLLERSLLHRGWARRMRMQLDADPTLSGLSLVTSRREMTVQRDSLGSAGNLEVLLEGLLERNPQNRMALEYLMAHYLLTRQIDKLAANRYRFDALGYPEFPQHIEEALVCYVAMTGLEDLDIGSRSFHPETCQRFGDFMEIQHQTKADPSLSFAALHPDFGDSYYFSFVFGHNIASLGVGRPPE